MNWRTFSPPHAIDALDRKISRKPTYLGLGVMTFIIGLMMFVVGPIIVEALF